ncbi:phasin family protein [Ferrimonas senticii]|uniref:phasin family protein n=1 Tax=Ferrimonas senticii TaxID=394566 RepID=UPI0004068E28|nr:phasin family protein [Ferrimonas senticii]
MDNVERHDNWLQDGEQMARNIWWAGLGVYGRSLQEGQAIEGRTSELFESLVEEGRQVEGRTRETIQQQVASTNRRVEQRVQALFGRMSGIDPNRVEQMNHKIDKLTEMVEKLASK